MWHTHLQPLADAMAALQASKQAIALQLQVAPCSLGRYIMHCCEASSPPCNVSSRFILQSPNSTSSCHGLQSLHADVNLMLVSITW